MGTYGSDSHCCCRYLVDYYSDFGGKDLHGQESWSQKAKRHSLGWPESAYKIRGSLNCRKNEEKKKQLHSVMLWKCFIMSKNAACVFLIFICSNVNIFYCKLTDFSCSFYKKNMFSSFGMLMLKLKLTACREKLCSRIMYLLRARWVLMRLQCKQNCGETSAIFYVMLQWIEKEVLCGFCLCGLQMCCFQRVWDMPLCKEKAKVERQLLEY